jgi:SlyX protein
MTPMNGNENNESVIKEELGQRVTELEIRFTHQARQIEELNDVLTECAAHITLLKKDNALFREMLLRQQPEMQESPDE